MHLRTLDSLATTLTGMAQQANELRFWRDYPEIQSISLSVSYVYDDEGAYFPSRTINGMEFVSEELMVSLLKKINLWAHEDDSLDAFSFGTPLDQMTLDDIDEKICFTSSVAQCCSDEEYVRPEVDLDSALASLEAAVRRILLDQLKGTTLYAVLEPAVEYDDQHYYVAETESGYLNGIFTTREEAALDALECDREIVTRYSAEEVTYDFDEPGWWGAVNPDDCQDPDRKLAIWRRTRPRFLTRIHEAELQ